MLRLVILSLAVWICLWAVLDAGNDLAIDERYSGSGSGCVVSFVRIRALRASQGIGLHSRFFIRFVNYHEHLAG